MNSDKLCVISTLSVIMLLSVTQTRDILFEMIITIYKTSLFIIAFPSFYFYDGLEHAMSMYGKIELNSDEEAAIIITILPLLIAVFIAMLQKYEEDGKKEKLKK